MTELLSQAVEGNFNAQALGEGATANVIVLQSPEGIKRILPSMFASPAQISLPPDFSELFEIISTPETIPAAVFYQDPGRGFAPYQVPYLPRRTPFGTTRQALYNKLFDSRGALLVEGRAGLGKSREVAELARYLCTEEGWTICVPTREVNARLDAPRAFPDELEGKRLLFILENLDKSVLSNKPQPYTERLENFLKFFELALTPGSWYVLATTRNEPKFQRQLGFDSSHPLWSHFERYELPEFTDQQLKNLLTGMAETADVSMDPDYLDEMIEESDRTPQSLFLNVDDAREKGLLSLSNWHPSQGRSWKEKLRAALNKYPASREVFKALHLVQQAGVPVRQEYVNLLGQELVGSDISTSAEALVDMGIVGLRAGILTLFGDELVEKELKTRGIESPEVEDYWEALITSITATIDKLPQHRDDLSFLALSLYQAGKFEDMENIATIAIEHGASGFFIFAIRGLARASAEKYTEAAEDFDTAISLGLPFTLLMPEMRVMLHMGRGMSRLMADDFEGAEADLTITIEGDQEPPEVYALRGYARYQQKNYPGALADLTAAIERQEGDGYTYFLRGLTRFETADYPGAEADLSEAISRGDESSAAYAYRGDARLNQGDFAGAESDYTASLEAGADHQELFYWRGIARYNLENYPGARQDIDQAISRGMDSWLVFAIRGDAHFKLNEFTEAEEDYSHAIQLGSESADVFFARGTSRFHRKNYAGAQADLSTALELGKGDLHVYGLRGDARYNLQDFAGAEADYTAAIERGQQAPFTYLWRGKARYAQEKYEAAEADFSTAIECEPQNREYHYWLGKARYMLDKDAEALADFSTAIELGMDDANVYYWRGRARGYLNDFAGAQADYDSAIERGRDDADVYYRHGRARNYLNDFVGAEADYDSAIERGRDDYIVYSLRGLARLRQNKFSTAEDDFTTAIERGQDDDNVYHLRGSSRFSQGDHSAALADFSAAIQRNQENIDAYTMRAYTSLLMKDYPQTVKDYTRAIELGLDDQYVYQNRAYALLKLDRLEEARRDLDETQKRAPDDPFTHGRWGDLHLALGEYDQAIERYQSALAAGENKGWYFELGLAYLLEGCLEEAFAAYEQGLVDPDPIDVEAALEALDHWTAKYEDRFSSPVAQSAIAHIRTVLSATSTS